MKKYIFILLFFIIIAFFLPLGMGPLFDLDEGAFSEATREMLVSGDYITTYLNGHLRFDKPILIYWLQLISIKIFGLNEFAFRLPSAIASLVWAFSIFWFTNRFSNLKKAFFATFFMITALQINVIAKAAIADALLNMFITLSMFFIYIYYKSKDKKYLYLTFLMIGFGTLTKGPVAIMIPLIVTFIFFIIKGEIVNWLKMIFNPLGILIFIIVASPWYIAEYLAQGDAFIHGFFIKHNISRFNSAMENHKGSLFYFIPVLIVGILPFTYFLFKIIFNIKNLIKDDLYLFLLLWFGFVFIFFSFSGTKLPHYIIYGYTPIFILSSIYIDRFNKNWLFYPMLTFLLIFFILPDLALIIKDLIRDKLAVVLIEHSHKVLNFWYRLSILGLILALILSKKKSSELFIIILGASMITLVNFIVLPLYGKLMQQPIKNAGLLARQRNYKDIVMYKVNTPSFNVYYKGLVLKRKPKRGDIVFTKVTKLNTLSGYKILYLENGFTLIKIE